MPKAHLHAVGADEAPQKRPRTPKTVSKAAESGDRLELLLATRTRVAKAVENEDTPARDLAALTRRLLEIAKEIEVLESAKRAADQDERHAADESFDASAV